MGDVVNIKPVRLEENFEFVQDCCRFQEGILTEANMKLKYRFADSIWEKLGDNTALLEAVEEEKIRRIRTGQQKREKAQLLVVQAPDVVAGIMLDNAANPRHRIDSAKVLNDFAANGPAAAPAADRFQIIINLNGDVERFDKSRLPDANDIDPFNDVGTLPQGVIAAIATKKKDDDQW